MFQTLKNAWKIPELRNKILFTLLMLLIFRIGCYIPVPGVNSAYIATQVENFNILSFMNTFSGGALSNYTLFAMGITPYINASIIMQLLTVAIPALERMQKEGEDGRKKINKITRIFGVVLAFAQSVGIILSMGSDAVTSTSILNYLTIGFALTAGTALVIWIGERISDKGIGNGISLLIFVGIVARLPYQIWSLFQQGELAGKIWLIPMGIIFFLLIVTGVTYIDLGQRRIPVQYAKRVVGRKMYGGQSTHIPLKVNSSGVLPLIFAITIIQFPGMIAQFWPTSGFYTWYQTWLGNGTVIYYVVYALLILFFTYFYSMISFNPVDIAKNLQQNGGFIPGIRPGKPTSDYLSRIAKYLTLFGALFLAALAVVPNVLLSVAGLTLSIGATSILIMVSVALETTKQLEAQMLMRNYEGFLKKN